MCVRVCLLAQPAMRWISSSSSWCRCWTRATSSSTAATRSTPTRRGGRATCASAASSTSARASPAARTVPATGPRLCPAATLKPGHTFSPFSRSSSSSLSSILFPVLTQFESSFELANDVRCVAVDCGESGRRAVLRLGRRRGRRSLREDGAQRHRVRRHAADRRGLPPDEERPRHDAARNGRHLRRVEQVRAGLVPHRNHRQHSALQRREGYLGQTSLS